MQKLRSQGIYVPGSNIIADIPNFPTLIWLDDHPIFDILDTDSKRFKHAILRGNTPLVEEILWWSSADRQALLAVEQNLVSGTDHYLRLVYDDILVNPNVYDRGGATSIWQENAATWFPFGDPSGTAPQLLDSSGYNNGTSIGGMTSGDLIDGYIAKATEFDGANDYYNCGTPPPFVAMFASFTFFIRPGGSLPGGRIMGKSLSAPSLGTELVRNANNAIEFGTSKDGTSWQFFVTANDICPDDEWTYVKITADGTTLRLYINGVEVTSGNFPYLFSDQFWFMGQPIYLASNAQNPDTFGGAIQFASLAVKAHSAAFAKAEYLGLTGQLIEFGEHAIDGGGMLTGLNYLAESIETNLTGFISKANTDLFTNVNDIGPDKNALLTGLNALSSAKMVTAQNELAESRGLMLTGINNLAEYGPAIEMMVTSGNMYANGLMLTGLNGLAEARQEMITGINELSEYGPVAEIMFTGLHAFTADIMFTTGNELAELIDILFTSGNILAGTGTDIMFTGVNALADESEFESMFTGLNRMGGNSFSVETDVSTEAQIIGNAVFVQPHQVYIDGIEISQMFTDLRISCKLNAMHNEIEIQGVGKAIFELADPETKPEIQVDIGTRSRKFVLESRIGNEEFCTLWGRSLSALDAMEDTLEEYIRIEEGQQILASAAAASVLQYNTLTWDVADWLLPIGFQVSGKPLKIIQRIAETVGAIIRPSDGLGITVTKRKSERPIHAQDIAPALEYDDLSIFRGDSTENRKSDNYDNVEIIGNAASIELPEIAVEALPDGQQRIIGRESVIRVWPGAGSGIELLDGFVTDGQIRYINRKTTTENQRVEFKKYQGSVSYPITALRKIEWIGDSGGLYSFETGGKSITIENDYAIADIEYQTTYHRYRLIGHGVEVLLAGIYVDNSDDAAIIAIDDQNPAPAITDIAIPGIDIMIARGTAFLDEQYDVEAKKFGSVYQEKLETGGIVEVNDSKVGSRGNYYVAGYDIISTGPSLYQEVEVELCLI